MSQSLKIGLFGFGVVGQGFYDVLQDSPFRDNLTVEKICIKDADKERQLPASYFTTCREDILEDDTIDLVVEVIDNAPEAFSIVSHALSHGKDVVTANKKMVAEHLQALFDLQEKHGTRLLYEAAACAAIPIVKTLDDFYGKEELKAIGGIFNGSSNYILTRIEKDGVSYEDALAKAQELGFAELDPTLDVDGYDALYKTLIFAAQGFGVFPDPDKVFRTGISGLTTADMDLARSLGTRIRLRSRVVRTTGDQVAVFVAPHFATEQETLYHIEGEDNTVTVEATHSGPAVFTGKGAGGSPTGSAVLSDVVAISQDYRYPYTKRRSYPEHAVTEGQTLRVCCRGVNQRVLNALDSAEKEGEKGEWTLLKVALADLLKGRTILEEEGVFLATLPDEVTSLEPDDQEVLASS